MALPARPAEWPGGNGAGDEPPCPSTSATLEAIASESAAHPKRPRPTRGGGFADGASKSGSGTACIDDGKPARRSNASHAPRCRAMASACLGLAANQCRNASCSEGERPRSCRITQPAAVTASARGSGNSWSGAFMADAARYRRGVEIIGALADPDGALDFNGIFRNAESRRDLLWGDSEDLPPREDLVATAGQRWDSAEEQLAILGARDRFRHAFARIHDTRNSIFPEVCRMGVAPMAHLVQRDIARGVKQARFRRHPCALRAPAANAHRRPAPCRRFPPAPQTAPATRRPTRARGASRAPRANGRDRVVQGQGGARKGVTR